MRTLALLFVLSCVAHASRIQGSGPRAQGSNENSNLASLVEAQSASSGTREAVSNPWKLLAWALLSANPGSAWQVPGQVSNVAMRSSKIDRGTGLSGGLGMPHAHIARTHVLMNAEGASGVVDAAVTSEKAFPNLPSSVKPGVVTGKALVDLLDYAKEKGFAIPGVNIVGTPSINACMEAAKIYGGPIMVTFSMGGGQFIAGKAARNDDYAASIAGTIAGAKHVHEVAKLYGVPVILHTDHCQKKWLPWIDGLMAANEEYFAQYGHPLFSSHMLDLSEETLEENVAICKKYLERMAKVDVLLEMELGITGGEEDGVDNTDVDSSKLYTQPEEVWYAYEQLSQVPNGAFTIAAAFGNVHGVYSPGNVKLEPVILHNTQKYISEKLGDGEKKPVKFVFHGGSGSSPEDIKYAIDAGVIKMNMDTDTQWAFWDGMRTYSEDNRDYLQRQIGNPEGDEKPNKKYYDPRMPIRSGEESMAKRLVEAAKDLGCVDVL